MLEVLQVATEREMTINCFDLLASKFILEDVLKELFLSSLLEYSVDMARVALFKQRSY